VIERYIPISKLWHKSQTMHYNVGFMGHTMEANEVRGQTMLIRVTLGVTNPFFTFLKKS
jgi:hypothetical protein